MKTPDLSTYSDADLGALLNEIRTEQEKRATLARIPQEMAEMQAQFLAQGGEPEAIAEALAAPLPAPEPDPAPEPVEEVAVLPDPYEAADSE